MSSRLLAPLLREQSKKYKSNVWGFIQPWLIPCGFLVALMALGIFIKRHDRIQNKNALIRDTVRVQQVIHMRLQSNLDFLNSLGYINHTNHLARSTLPGAAEDQFQMRAQYFLGTNPEIEAILWEQPDHSLWVSSFKPDWVSSPKYSIPGIACEATGKNVSYHTTYSQSGNYFYTCQKIGGVGYASMMIAVYPLDRFIRHTIPLWYLEKYTIDIHNDQHRSLTNPNEAEVSDSVRLVTHTLPFDESTQLPLRLYATSEVMDDSPQQFLIFGLVLGLSGIILWGLKSIRTLIKAKNQTEAAHASESMFRKAIESSVITGLLALDHTGTLIYANSSFCRMVGLHEDELKGTKPPFAFWAEADAEEYNDRLQRCFERQSGVHLLDEMRVHHRHGSLFYARFYVSPLRDLHDQHVGWMISVVDITEPHKTRQALTLAQERFIAVLDGLDAMVSVADPVSGELLYTNRAYQDFSHHPFSKNIGQNIHMQLHELIQNHATATSFEPTEKRHRHAVVPVQQDCWLDVRERWIEWVDDRLVRLQIATDITVQRTVQHLMDEQQDRLEKNSRLIAMGEMASTLAHELNQPLTAITSYSKGCLRYLDKVHWQEDESEIKQDVLGAIQKVAQQAERAGRIVGRIRNFVKKTEPQKTQCELLPLIEEAVALAEIEFEKRGVHLIRDIHPPFPAVWLDPILIEQLLFNLLKNAAEAVDMQHKIEPDMTDFSVRLEVFKHAGTIQIGVHDHGIGLPKDAHDRLFSAFYTTKVGGMGMGLKICRSIVEFHQGRLWPESRQDGTTFWFTLPIHEHTVVVQNAVESTSNGEMG